MLRRLAFGLLLLIAATTLAGLGVAFHYVRRWDAIVSERFRTHRWDFPSKIYSDSQLIYPGMDLKAVGFLDRLHDLGLSTCPRRGRAAKATIMPTSTPAPSTSTCAICPRRPATARSGACAYPSPAAP